MGDRGAAVAVAELSGIASKTLKLCARAILPEDSTHNAAHSSRLRLPIQPLRLIQIGTGAG